MDPEDKRYFSVWNPEPIVIQGTKTLKGHAPLHPDHPERGVRQSTLAGEDGIAILITHDDSEKIQSNEKVRLKDLCNVQLTSKNAAQYIGDDLALIKEGVKIIHWVGEEAIPTKLYMPDGSIREGRCETILEEDLGSVVQFERLGFVRVWAKSGGYGAYFAHR